MNERLRRLERIYTDHPVYFVTFCTAVRKPMLDCLTMHESFVRFCRTALERNVFVGRYVLMPDHIHLFVTFSEPKSDLSGWIKSLKNSLSKVLRASGILAPHWQKGFFDHVLRSQESYSQKWLYMVENPVRAGLVSHWQDWPWQGEIHPLAI